jgi:hypothetical protein
MSRFSGNGSRLILLFVLVEPGLYYFKSDLECFDFSSESEETLMDFALQMHLNSLFSVIDGLNGPADFTNLYGAENTFWCLTTASKLSPIMSTSFRCSLSLSTSSKHLAESSICPF